MKCPQCGAEMICRKNRKKGNEFWGCSNFPRCYGTVGYKETYLGDNKVGIGAKVDLLFLNDKEQMTLEIVDPYIEDVPMRTGLQYTQGQRRVSPTFGVVPPEGLGESCISANSRLGKLLLGKKCGEIIQYREEDNGSVRIKILSVY